MVIRFLCLWNTETYTVRIAVIGAGINGLCTGWELAKAGHAVTIFERDQAVSQTSQASSKLLHGGLRYLENLEFRLVRESLQERRAWVEDAPHIAKPLELLLPIYRYSRRGRWQVKLGLTLYDLLARGSGFPEHKWLSATEVFICCPGLSSDSLIGAFSFWDGQMDDHALGLWVAEQFRQANGTLQEHTSVDKISTEGGVWLKSAGKQNFERIINAAGPWAESLLHSSKISSRYTLDLVRGSHLVLERPCPSAYLLEVPAERRIFFVLPWKSGTLIGTTEVRQDNLNEAIPTEAETQYLLMAYNNFFTQKASEKDIRESFAGVRPLIRSAQNPSRTTRESVVIRQDKLINVFGGKWTTARALARRVREVAEQI